MRSLAEVLRRLAGREMLDPLQLVAEFRLAGIVEAEDLIRALEIFDEEFDVSPGCLRPDDELSLCTAPPVTRNPISWYFRPSAQEDGISELDHHLKKAGRARGVGPRNRAPLTVREYVLTWAGQDLEMEKA